MVHGVSSVVTPVVLVRPAWWIREFTVGCQRDCADSPPHRGACVTPEAVCRQGNPLITSESPRVFVVKWSELEIRTDDLPLAVVIGHIAADDPLDVSSLQTVVAANGDLNPDHVVDLLPVR